MKTKTLIACSLIGYALIASSLRAFAADGRTIAVDGAMAPNFTLSSGDRKTLVKEDIAGRVIVCFYETDSTATVNDDLKDELRKVIESKTAKGLTPDEGLPYVLAVADCSKAKWPCIPLWESALRSRSKSIGYTLWGDWSGEMREDYRFAKDEANFALIDRYGRIRCQSVGKVERGTIEEIVALTVRLMGETK